MAFFCRDDYSCMLAGWADRKQWLGTRIKLYSTLLGSLFACAVGAKIRAISGYLGEPVFASMQRLNGKEGRKVHKKKRRSRRH